MVEPALHTPAFCPVILWNSFNRYFLALQEMFAVSWWHLTWRKDKGRLAGAGTRDRGERRWRYSLVEFYQLWKAWHFLGPQAAGQGRTPKRLWPWYQPPSLHGPGAARSSPRRPMILPLILFPLKNEPCPSGWEEIKPLSTVMCLWEPGLQLHLFQVWVNQPRVSRRDWSFWRAL